MKFPALHRYSWMLLIVAAAVSIGTAPSLAAEPSAPEAEAPAAKGAPAQLKTLVVVAGARYEKLLSDVSFLGPYLGQPAAGQMADAVLAQYTLGKSATALDKTKPWGIIVQTDGMQPFYVACLPVANADDIVEIAKAHNAEVKDGENGTKELSIPNKPPLFLKTENGVAFLSISPASLEKLPPNALEILSERVGDYDVTVSVAVKNIPPMYRQIAIGALQAGMQQNMKKLPDETDDQYAERERVAEGQLNQLTQFINEVDTLKVSWAIDAPEKRTYFDFEYKFVQGSKLAQEIATYSQPDTKFAGFYQTEAAATAMVATKGDMSDLQNMMRTVRQQAEREIDKKHAQDAQEDRDALKAAAKDIFDAVDATIKEGQIDGGASLNASPDSLTFVAGVHLKDPAKIEDAFKKMEAVGKKKQPDFPGIKWNAAEHAGVKFHTLTVPVPEDKKGARKMLGETMDVSIGIGPDVVYVAAGKDNIAAVSKAIDASTADRSKKSPPFAVSVSLGQLIALAADSKEGHEKEVLEAIANKLNGEAKGHDHIRITGSVIADGMRFRLEGEEGVLQAIGTAAVMKQQARQARPN